MPLYTIIYNYIPLHTTTYHYIPLHTTTYHYIPLHTTTDHYRPVYTTTYQYIPLHTIIYSGRRSSSAPCSPAMQQIRAWRKQPLAAESSPTFTGAPWAQIWLQRRLPLKGRPWVVFSGAISRVTIVVIVVKALITSYRHPWTSKWRLSGNIMVHCDLFVLFQDELQYDSFAKRCLASEPRSTCGVLLKPSR